MKSTQLVRKVAILLRNHSVNVEEFCDELLGYKDHLDEKMEKVQEETEKVENVANKNAADVPQKDAAEEKDNSDLGGLTDLGEEKETEAENPNQQEKTQPQPKKVKKNN